jgi:hypothetical protein
MLPVDKLDQQILEKEKRCAELRHQLEFAEVELRALKLAGELRPSRASGSNRLDQAAASLVGGSVSADSAPRKKTKGAWALSAPYRRLVQEIIAKGNPLMDTAELAELGKTIGFTHSPRDMSGRFKRYSMMGMAERSGHRYRLTEAAVRAFSDPANEPPVNVRWRNL